MFKNKVFLAILLFLMAVIAYSFFKTDAGDKLSYNEKIKLHREKVDQDILAQENSPILDPSQFKGLNYYAPDEAFVVSANFEPIEDTASVQMNNGTQGTNKKVGHVQFELGGGVHKLAVFQEEQDFFIPFRDLSSTTETYGGGRYIKIAIENIQSSRFEIDFNLAYNPYCAYNPSFICPIPPKENDLPVAIHAGEKLLNRH